MGHKTGTNVRKMTLNSPKLEFFNINTFIKFGENLSICYQDIVWKLNLAYIKAHNSGANVPKMMYNNPKLDLVNMNAYII